MFKRGTIVSLALLLISTQNSTAIVLQSSVIKLLDGVWPALDGESLYKISWLIVRFDAMVNGKIINKETKERQGMYKIDDKFYTIKDLGGVEKQYSQDAQKQKKLQELLKIIKKDFIKINEVFIVEVQRYKQFILKLMQESCDRRGVRDSFMLRWADTPFGKEEESFDKNMKSFVELHKFLIELRNFMSDLFESCPKGYVQYLEIIKKQKAGA